MKNKIKHSLVLICIILILFACAPKPEQVIKQEKLSLLEKELDLWKSFKITGILDAQYQAFTLRNSCVIQKNDDKFRADVLSSGLFGLGGGIMMAAYIDRDKMQLRRPGSQTIEDVPFDTDTQAGIKFVTDELFVRLESEKNIIAETNKTEIEGFEIFFTPLMRLSEIRNREENLRITLNYDRQENLIEINAFVPSIRRLTIHIDKIEHADIMISELRKIE